jgi:hypothetical protein
MAAYKPPVPMPTHQAMHAAMSSTCVGVATFYSTFMVADFHLLHNVWPASHLRQKWSALLLRRLKCPAKPTTVVIKKIEMYFSIIAISSIFRWMSQLSEC